LPVLEVSNQEDAHLFKLFYVKYRDTISCRNLF
jgi:hypothetical protein